MNKTIPSNCAPVTFNTSAKISVQELDKFINSLNSSFLGALLFNPYEKQVNTELIKQFLDVYPKHQHTLKNEVIHQFIPDSSDYWYINKISINSPGILEFIGALNPLNFLQEIFKEYHQHKKAMKELAIAEQQSSLEARLKEIEIVKKRIELLKEAGINQRAIKSLVMYTIVEPNLLLLENKKFVESVSFVKSTNSLVYAV